MKNVNSPKQIDEVTYVQFRNALGRTGLEVSGDETELIAMKFPGKVRLGLGLGVGRVLTRALTLALTLALPPARRRASSTTLPSCAPLTRASASSPRASPG